MQRRFISLIALAALAGSAAVAAAPPEAPTSASASGRDMAGLEARWALPLTFKSFDANQDGYISRQEAATSPLLARQFDQLDTDGDGRLSPQELGASVAQDTAAGGSRTQASRGGN